MPIRRRGHRLLDADFSWACSVRQVAADPGAGVYSDLSVGAPDQRPDYGRVPAGAKPVRARQGADRAGRRLSVHRADIERPRVDVSRLIFTCGPAWCRPADDRVALHGLARRLSTFCHRLCVVRRGTAAAPLCLDAVDGSNGYRPRDRLRGLCHAGPASSAGDHAGGPLHVVFGSRGDRCLDD